MTTPHGPPPPGEQFALPPRPEGARSRGSGSRRAGWLIFLVALLSGALAAGIAVVVIDLMRDTDDRTDGGADGGAATDDEPQEQRTSEEPEDEGDHEAVGFPPLEAPSEASLAAAVSQTREDSVYPDVGDPVVDALHYAVDLSWFPERSDEFSATTTVTFRATQNREDFQLDLAETISVDSVTVDDVEVDFDHVGKDLFVDVPVATDQRYTVTVVYGGPPEPAEAPTTRSDFDDGVGLTRSDGQDYEGWLWTMQEPYGAFTWYPVNDQPADKALYDVTVRTQPGWTGVSNGVVLDEGATPDESAIRFHADAPMSSYLVTVAVGDYELTEDVSESGVPLYYWTPAHDESALTALEETREALAYVEELLGPYPFSSLGSVVVDSQSAMETQTMITYGNTEYALSVPTIVHEIAHQWYGNKVSPADWSEVWMNEGMATYLQLAFESDSSGSDLDRYVRFYANDNADLRAEAGPPAAYDPTRFAESNIYFIPAVMWHELRREVGDEAFWAMARAWPAHAGGAFVSTDRTAYWPWVSQQLGRDLTPFFTAWLLDEEQPDTTF